LRIRNRPLDQDYVPHLPIDMDGPEGGYYWVMVAKQQLPPEYRQWVRMTVAGRVTGTQRYENEPVLWLLYVRGWGGACGASRDLGAYGSQLYPFGSRLYS
jgi:hypothetical protein